MGMHRLLVFSDPAEGREDEYNDWYDQVHLGEVLQVPGFVAAQRFRVEQAPGGQLTQRYLAVYDVEADDPGEILPALGAAVGSMNMSDAYDRSRSVIVLVSPVGDRVTADAEATST